MLEELAYLHKNKYFWNHYQRSEGVSLQCLSMRNVLPFVSWVNRRGIYSVSLCSEERMDQTVAALWLNPEQTWKCGGGRTLLNESSLISASVSDRADRPLIVQGERGIEGEAAGHGKAFLTHCNCDMRESCGGGVKSTGGASGGLRGQFPAVPGA